MSLARFEFTDRVRPVVEIGIGSAQVPTGGARWDDAVWDDPTSLWSGDEPLWRDITCDVQATDLVIGRARLTDPFDPSTAEIVVDNSTGWADPAVETPGVLTLRPGRPIRVGVVHSLYGVRWQFRGWIDRIEPLYEPETPDTVRLGCIDALGEVGRAKLAQTTATGAGETASARVERILDAVPWLDSKRDIEHSSVELVAGVLEGQVLDMLRRCADSAGGACFGDTDGNVVFRNRDWLYHTTGTPLDGTIGNSSTTMVTTGFAGFPGDTGIGLHGDTSAAPIASAAMTVIACIRPAALPPGEVQTIMAHAGSGGVQFALTPSGQLRFLWWWDGSNFAWRYSGPLVGAPMGSDGWLWVAVEFDAAGPIKFYASPDGESWVPVGSTSTSPTTVQPEPGDLWIGALNTGVIPFAGDVARLIVRDGVDGNMTGGSVVFDFDATADIVNPAATTITTTSGHMLTVTGDVTLVESVETVVPDVCPSGWRRPFVREDLTTRVIVDRMVPPGDPPGTPRIYNDTPSQLLYGIETWERLDLWTRDDDDLDTLAQRVLAQRSAVTMPIVDGVTVDAEASGPAGVDLLALLDLKRPLRYRCRLIEPRGTIFDARYFVTGATIHMDPLMWTADLSLDWSELYEIPPTAAEWDESRWDRATWT